MGAAAAVLGGVGEGIDGARKQKVLDEFHAAQTDLVKKEAKAKESALLIDQLRAKILSGMSPEDQARALYPKVQDPREMLKALQESGILGGGAAPTESAPPIPYGGGTPTFPLDPSLGAGTRPSVPSMIADVRFPSLQFDSIDLSTGAMKLGPAKTRALKGIAGPEGPVTVQTTEAGVPIPGSALPEHQANIDREEQDAQGNTIAYQVNPSTQRVVPGSMRIKSRPTPVPRTRVLPDGTKIEEDVNPFTGEGVGKESTIVLPGGSRQRVTGLPPVSEFKFTDNEGVEHSAIRNTQTGALVTTPVPTSPPKGVTATDAGKIEGAIKALKFYDGIRASFVNPDGTFNRKMALKVWAPAGGIGEGRKILAQFREGLDVKTRVMSGAAIRPEEEAMYKAIYLPHPLDSDETAIDKLNRYNDTMSGLRALIDPSGTGAGRIERATSKPATKAGKGKVKSPAQMSDEELLGELRK